METATVSDSVTALTPCAQRLIIRNYGRENRKVRLFVEGNRPAPLSIRGFNTKRQYGFASLVLPLPERGAAGSISAGNTSVAFDSRKQPSCPQSLGDSVPDDLPLDYEMANTLFPRDADISALYPGIVMVTWKRPVDSVAVDSWVRTHGAFYIYKSSIRPHSYALWFDGDDASASLAVQRADELERTSLVLTAEPMLQIF